jgi:hypothetical protein
MTQPKVVTISRVLVRSLIHRYGLRAIGVFLSRSRIDTQCRSAGVHRSVSVDVSPHGSSCQRGTDTFDSRVESRHSRSTGLRRRAAASARSVAAEAAYR